MLYNLCLKYYRADRAEWYKWRTKRWSQSRRTPPRQERLTKLVFRHALHWRSFWQIYREKGV